jgi:hypothetical protein
MMRYLNCLEGRAIKVIHLDLEPYPMSAQRLTPPVNQNHIMPELFAGQTPSLTYLAFHSMFVKWGSMSALSNLTTFLLEHLYEEFSPTVDEIFAFFHATLRLTTLLLANVECWGFDIYTLEPPLLSALTHLYFQGVLLAFTSKYALPHDPPP